MSLKCPTITPDILTSLSIISILSPGTVMPYDCHGPGLLVTHIKFYAPKFDPVNMLLDLLHRKPYWGPQDLVLDADTVEQVTPHQGVGESVQETLDSKHRGALKISVNWQEILL